MYDAVNFISYFSIIETIIVIACIQDDILCHLVILNDRF
jgi:hypothetical protein